MPGAPHLHARGLELPPTEPRRLDVIRIIGLPTALVSLPMDRIFYRGSSWA
jgi:hypothetical protein